MKPLHLLMIFLLGPVVNTAQAGESADATFVRAAQLADVDLTQSREMYRLAALRYLDEAREQPAARGPLLYDAGNAFLFAGENGRAVVAYRRAELLMPGSLRLRDNLAFVRKQSGNQPDLAAPARLAALRFWRWNQAALWLWFAGAWLLFWAGLYRGQWAGRRWPRPVLVGALAGAVFMAGALLFQRLERAQRCRGVIVATRVEARKGPNYGYAPAFTATLDAGLEGDVIARQGDWLQMRFEADREAWVRLSAVEIWQGELPGE